MTRQFYRDPLGALGNPEADRVTDPDDDEASLIGLNKGILQQLQAGLGGGSVATATLTSVPSGTASVQLLAANAVRRGATIFNTDVNALFVKCGTAASSTSFTVKILADGYWEMPPPVYTGVVHGIWAADGAGLAIITEF